MADNRKRSPRGGKQAASGSRPIRRNDRAAAPKGQRDRTQAARPQCDRNRDAVQAPKGEFIEGRRAAAEALRTGFVHAVVAPDQLDAKVDELARAITVASPDAVRACKKLVQDVAERDINAQLIAATVEGIADIRASEQGREGVQSFLQKRKPGWLA